MQKKEQHLFRSPSPSINYEIPTQLNAPNTAGQHSQATMHFDGLQLDHQFLRMPGHLNLVSRPHSLLLKALTNAPLVPNPSQAHICACPTIHRFKPSTIAFPDNPISISLSSFAVLGTHTTRPQPRG